MTEYIRNRGLILRLKRDRSLIPLIIAIKPCMSLQAKHIIQICLFVITKTRSVSACACLRCKEECTSDSLHPVNVAKLRSKNMLLASSQRQGQKWIYNNQTKGSTEQHVERDLCALACFEMAQLKSKVIHGNNFQYFLRLVPKVWQLIKVFYSSDSTLALEYLKHFNPILTTERFQLDGDQKIDSDC